VAVLHKLNFKINYTTAAEMVEEWCLTGRTNYKECMKLLKNSYEQAKIMKRGAHLVAAAVISRSLGEDAN
jgi:hypothetical protein